MILGFTAGRIGDEEVFLKRLRFFRSIGCNALELHPDKGLQELVMSSQISSEIEKFDYVSLHAPASGFWYDNTPESVLVLQAVDKLVEQLSIKLVVIHPDRIRASGVLKEMDWPLGIENMDWRKEDGTSVVQMEKWLNEFPQAKMVLDINHTFTIDRSLSLLKDMHANFSAKISQIHISGFIDEERIHEPITLSNCFQLAKAIPNKQLPTIIEVDTTNLSQRVLQTEFEYLQSILRPNV